MNALYASLINNIKGIMLCGSMVKYVLANIVWHLEDILGAILLVKDISNGKNNLITKIKRRKRKNKYNAHYLILSEQALRRHSERMAQLKDECITNRRIL